MKHRFFIFSLFAIYMIVMTALMVWQGIGIYPERYALLLLLVSLVFKRTRNFLWDWMPFIFILISYDFLRIFVENLAPKTHYLEPAGVDFLIFQAIPAEVLQRIFFHPPTLAWYDFLATFFYFQHFALFVSFAFLLWINSKNYFKEFVTAISLLSYSAWATYFIFPAAPPWLAAERGYIGGVSKILDFVLKTVPGKLDLPATYHNLNPNPIAGIPSMHTAYVVLIFLFALRYFKLKALSFLLYVLGVLISLVYLGEHYVIDIIAGILYAIFFYIISTEVLHTINWQLLWVKIRHRLPI